MAYPGGKWVLQLPRGTGKLKAAEWLQESRLSILAPGAHAT